MFENILGRSVSGETLKVFRVVRTHPGMTLQQLCWLFKIGPRLLWIHLGLLLEKGWVELREDGGNILLYPILNRARNMSMSWQELDRLENLVKSSNCSGWGVPLLNINLTAGIIGIITFGVTYVLEFLVLTFIIDDPDSVGVFFIYIFFLTQVLHYVTAAVAILGVEHVLRWQLTSREQQFNRYWNSDPGKREKGMPTMK